MFKELLYILKLFLISLMITVILTTFFIPVHVRGYSMYPTIEPFNFLLVNKVSYKYEEPRRGDIVVFTSPLVDSNGKYKLFIKRVIAVKDDRLKIENGVVYVNEERIEENYLQCKYTSGSLDIIIPKGTVFVMGDNRQNSLDSRDEKIGVIRIDKIRGKAFFRFYPFNKIGRVY